MTKPLTIEHSTIIKYNEKRMMMVPRLHRNISCCYRYNPASGFNSSTLNISQIMVVKRVRGNRWSHVEAEASFTTAVSFPSSKYLLVKFFN
uniref:Uncharacterized protein n=1 Tax=Timema poppense TaxID=170557 RepID=A0A7R9D3L4_TIMPO|nr:unnamed protein product [Timema poppensis]